MSYLDLKRYVDENPELAALAKKTMNIREGSEQGPPLGGADVGSLVIPANDEEMQRLSPAQRRQLQWVSGSIGLMEAHSKAQSWCTVVNRAECL